MTQAPPIRRRCACGRVSTIYVWHVDTHVDGWRVDPHAGGWYCTGCYDRVQAERARAVKE